MVVGIGFSAFSWYLYVLKMPRPTALIVTVPSTPLPGLNMICRATSDDSYEGWEHLSYETMQHVAPKLSRGHSLEAVHVQSFVMN